MLHWVLFSLLAVAKETPRACLDAYGDTARVRFDKRGAVVADSIDRPLRELVAGLPKFFGQLGRGADIIVVARPDLEAHQSSATNHLPIINLGLADFALERVRPILIHESTHKILEERFRIRLGGRLLTFREARAEAGASAFLFVLLSAYEALTRPFAELIADLGAVLHDNDLSAMANALDFSHSPPYKSAVLDAPESEIASYRFHNPQGPRPRDSAATASFKAWGHAHPEFPSISEYITFDPVRGVIGRWLKKGRIRRTPTNADEILEAVIEAAEAQFDQVAHPADYALKPTVESLNRDFLLHLLNRLRAHSLWVDAPL